MKTLLTFLFSIVSVALLAQSTPSKPAPAGADCFKEWYTVFKERGANPVADGTHDVVITLRYGTYSECYLGKVDVANGKLSGKLLVQKMDGSYEEWDKKVSASYQDSEGILKQELRDVTNGMSASLTLTDGEIIRLFFYKSLAAKPKSNKKAPSPAALVK